jgi:hypothetical protein
MAATAHGDQRTVDHENTRSVVGSLMICPAHTQHPAMSAMATRTTTWPWGVRRRHALADLHPDERHADGHEDHERSGQRAPACLARASLRPLHVGHAVLGQCRESPSEVGATDLVGDQERLAGDVGGGVGEVVLQDTERPLEVGREQPLAVRAVERGPEVGGSAGADLEQRLGTERPSDPVRSRISSIIRGHASFARTRRCSRRNRYEAIGADAPIDEERECWAGRRRRASSRQCREASDGRRPPRRTPRWGPRRARPGPSTHGAGPLAEAGGRTTGRDRAPPAEDDRGVEQERAVGGALGDQELAHGAVPRQGGSRDVDPASARCPAMRVGTFPVHTRRSRPEISGEDSVVVNWPWSADEVRSSTPRTDVTTGPSGRRAEWTTTSTASVTSEVSAPMERLWPCRPAGRRIAVVTAPGGRAGVDGGEPFTPDERVSRRGSASRSRTSPTMAMSGAMRRKPATSDEVDLGPVGAAGRVCMLATFATGTSASKTSSAITTRSDGSSSAAQHDRRVVLPAPGRSGEDDREPGLGHRRGGSRRPSRRACRARPARERSAKGTPVNLRMFTITCPPRLMSPWTMWRRAPSSSWASWSPSVGSSLRCAVVERRGSW